MNTKLEFLEEEIRRTYRVLNAENAELQNLVDINHWFNDKQISESDFDYLKILNSIIYKNRITKF